MPQVLDGHVKEEMYNWPEQLLTSHLQKGSTEIEEGGEQFRQMTSLRELTYETNECAYICGERPLFLGLCASSSVPGPMNFELWR